MGRMKFKGLRVNVNLMKPRKKKNGIQILKREIKTCEKFIAMNIAYGDALDDTIRQLETSRKTMRSNFEKLWRHPTIGQQNIMALFPDIFGDPNFCVEGLQMIDKSFMELQSLLRQELDVLEEKIEMEERIKHFTQMILEMERSLIHGKMDNETYIFNIQ